jgi:hypothetical protein
MDRTDDSTPENQFRTVMGVGRGTGRSEPRVRELAIHRFLDLSTEHLPTFTW